MASLVPGRLRCQDTADAKPSCPGLPRGSGCARASSLQVTQGETSGASRTRGSQFLHLLSAATGPVPSPAASGKNCSSPCRVSLQHISFWNQVIWACKSMNARTREGGRFSLFSECVCLSGQQETGRSLFPWLVSCYKSLSLIAWCAQSIQP